MFEMDAATSDRHFVIWAIGHVDDLGWHLGREAEQISRPCALRYDLPFAPSERWRGLLRQCPDSTRRRAMGLTFGMSIKSPSNPSNRPVTRETRQRHVDRATAGDVEKILR